MVLEVLVNSSLALFLSDDSQIVELSIKRSPLCEITLITSQAFSLGLLLALFTIMTFTGPSQVLFQLFLLKISLCMKRSTLHLLQ